MPSIDVRLVWSVEISPDQLGAHLEAYINALPAITTFRLCNRFGKGKKCHVTRLPTELVEEIVGLVHERKKPLFKWTRLFRCHEARCKPMQHYTKADIVKRYEAEFGEGPMEYHPDMAKSIQACFAFVEEIGESDPEEDNMQDMHREMKEEWLKLTGVPGLSDRGFFTKHKATIFAQFGLETLVSHHGPLVPKKGQHDRLEMDEMSRTTSAYLILPTTGVASKKFEHRYDEYRGSRQTTEDHMVASVGASPLKLSEDATRHFARAMKLLGLKPIATRNMQHISAGDEDPLAVEQKTAAKASNSPSLKLLVTSKDEYCTQPE